MILADKITEQRKRCGWSQEELAEKLGVSRQAVSKWEGAQSAPDLARILEMGRLFGVSTDYLLKDELAESAAVSVQEDEPPVLRVSMETASEFLSLRNSLSARIAFAVFLCVISPICLLILGAAGEAGLLALSENAAGGIGLIILFLLVAPAVAVFISCGVRSQPYEYLEKEAFETDYGVTGMVKERQRQYRDTYIKYNILGAAFCILSVIPLFSAIIVTENDFALVLAVAALLLLVAVGAAFFVAAGIRWESMQKLLQEGDYTARKKKGSAATDAIKTGYWLIVTACFLGYSFFTDGWDRSWIIWPVAGVLFAVVVLICNAMDNRS